MDLQQIGSYLQELRKKHDYTQSELAEILNVSHQAVSRWEKGDNLPDVMKLSELSKLYSISIDDILHNKFEVIEKEVVEKQHSPLTILTVVASIFSLIGMVVYISLIGSSTEHWISVVIQLTIIMLSSLFYIVPYSLLKKPTLGQFKTLRTGTIISFSTLFFTLPSILDGGAYIEEEFVLVGVAFVVIINLILYTLFNEVEIKLFDTNKKSFLFDLVSEFTFSNNFIIITIILIVYSTVFYVMVNDNAFIYDYVALMILISTLVLLLKAVLNKDYGLIALTFFIGILVAKTIYYVFSRGPITVSLYNQLAEFEGVFNFGIQIVAVVVIIIILIRYLTAKTRMGNLKGLYAQYVLAALVSVALNPLGTLEHTRSTINGVSTNKYELAFYPEIAFVPYIVLTTIATWYIVKWVMKYIENKKITQVEGM